MTILYYMITTRRVSLSVAATTSLCYTIPFLVTLTPRSYAPLSPSPPRGLA